MLTLDRALSAKSTAGDPLPPVFRQFVEHGVDFRAGQLAIVAAGPGGYKSVFAANLAVRTHVPTLYVSADTDHVTTATRVAAMLSGDPMPVIEAAVKAGGGQRYSALIEGLEDVRWSFESSPAIEDIRDDVEAFGHVYGCYPSLVVIDNLVNVYSDEEDHTAYAHNVEALTILARETGACVVVLHHLTGAYESGDIPPPLGALLGKVGKFPSLVLTMFRGGFGDLGVCVVKNRHGPADSRGVMRMYLPVDSTRARVG